MKYLLWISLATLTLIVASPWIMGFIDMYYWFFFNTTLSGAPYLADRFLAMIISFCLTIPTISILLFHIEVEQKRKRLRGENNE